MDNRVFVILAAGSASRFDGEGYKQLWRVEGECLLERTIRLFGKHGEVYVLTHNDELVLGGAKKIEPEGCGCTCESALSSRGVWGEQTTILLGDVYYTEDAVRRIVSRRRSLLYYSDGHDIFAIGFAKKKQKVFADELMYVNQNIEETWQGRLWHSYHHLYGYSKRPKVRCWTRGVHYIADRTQDFDTIDDFAEFEAGLSKNILHPRNRVKQKWAKQICQALALLLRRN